MLTISLQDQDSSQNIFKGSPLKIALEMSNLDMVNKTRKTPLQLLLTQKKVCENLPSHNRRGKGCFENMMNLYPAVIKLHFMFSVKLFI